MRACASNRRVGACLAHPRPLPSRGRYLLAVHVREYSTVDRVAQILSALPPGKFELLPAHEWIAVADAHPTFRNRYK